MLLGCIADDFTGASDVANTLAKGGIATAQFIGVPAEESPVPTCEAGVVALKTRSVAAAKAVRPSLDALRWLRRQGCRQILFKYCSTFDSTPEGNIGPVAEALANELDCRGVVVCPAFPGAARTLYQGHLFVGDRLLSESGMERHPLNPMTDPDIRRWLRRQTAGEVGHVGHAEVRKGAAAIRTELGRLAEAGVTLAVVDAVTDDDLRAIGTALDGAKLVTGGSGIALGLPGNFARQGLLGEAGSAFVGVAGPAAILAGSCSAATRGQIREYAQHHPSLALDVEAVLAGTQDAHAVAAFVRAQGEAAPLVYSSAEPEEVAAAQRRFGGEKVAGALEQLFGETARLLVREAGVRRLVVAGGETSGAVVTALGLTTLAIGPEIDPGVPAMETTTGEGQLALALKSGNFGAADFFEKALRALGGEGSPSQSR